MRITMVGNFGLWQKGTMGVRALPMAKALVERGHSVCIVVPPWDDPAESGLEATIDGVTVANLKLPPRIPLFWHGLLTIAVLWRTLREPSDVVHIFKPKAYAGFAGMLVWSLRKLGLSRVRLVVDTDDWEGTGGWNEIESFPRPIKWFAAWHERTGLRWCDAVTVASKALELLTWSTGVSRNEVHYVPNGVFIKDLAPMACWRALTPNAQAEKDSNHNILLFTRFFEYRLEKIVALLHAILELDAAARLIVVGKGLRGEEERLAALLRNAGLADKAVFVGWVEKEEVSRWFGMADVAIYPMDDNLLNRAKCPMKLVDLMVNGVPVVAERVGQVAEYVEDGVSGVLVEPDDIPRFARAVVSLLADEAGRRRLAERARERILEKFDWRRLISGIESAYGLRAPDPEP
ncbi:MAG: glycosyltransferase family 4 protein [Chloroflexi bacterium]|nr:glycosyltransferase family 4 protein [Chloroflexota bacterium]